MLTAGVGRTWLLGCNACSALRAGASVGLEEPVYTAVTYCMTCWQ